jgi:acyl carrier protein
MKNLGDAVQDEIYQALRILNEERPADAQIPIEENTCLFGENSALDSLALVSIIVDLETALSDKFNCTISLTDDKAMSQQPVPFTNVSVLKAYILELLA